MSRFISKVSRRNSEVDGFIDNPPFPLAGAALGLLAIVNVVSVVTTLMSA
jgi:hypothetical protein